MGKYSLLICMCIVVFGSFYPSETSAQSCNTPLRLLDQAVNCDRKWDDYKDGYQYCVMNAAEWFWKKYDCSWNSVEKLNKACEGCAKTYKKTKESSPNKDFLTKTSKEIKSVDAVLFKETTKGTTAEEKSDNYSVESGGTYKPPPQPPPKKCRRVCTTKYYDCSIDCWRGEILVMGGCIAKCSIENCEDVCE